MLLCCPWVAIAGCGRLSQTPVSGVVTVDSQPLVSGTIQIAPLGGETPSQAAMIKDGKFETELYKTKYKVQIFAPQTSETPSNIDAKGPGSGPPTKEILPPRYNIDSKLELNVIGPTSDVTFELTRK